MLPLTCHVPSNRGRQPLTPLSPMTFTYHIAWSRRNRPRAIPDLEFRTGTSSVTTTPPHLPSAHFFFFFFPPFLVTTCTRARSHLTKRTQNVSLAPLPPKRVAGFQTEDTKRERKKKKTRSISLPPTLPSFLLSFLSEQTPMFTFFPFTATLSIKAHLLLCLR